MLTKEISVTQYVKVTIDESKFTPEFFEEFNKNYFYFGDNGDDEHDRKWALENHCKHLAQLHARGIYDDDDFIEGYGPAKDMGIRFEIVDQSERVEEEY